MIPYIENPADNSSYCMGFGPMAQNTRAVAIWDYAIKTAAPAAIVELGTGKGAFTCCLGVICKNYGISLHTFDVFLDCPWPEWFEYLGINFHGGRDIFASLGFGDVRDLIVQEGLVFLLCDGGNKPREWNRFAPHLKPGDLIAAHDYRVDPGHAWPYTEITEGDIEYQSQLLNLKPFLQDEFNEAGWLVRRRE